MGMINYLVEGADEQLDLLLAAYDIFSGIENGNIELVAEVIQPKNDPDGQKMGMFQADLLEMKNLYFRNPISREKKVFSVKDNRLICSEEHLRILSWACDLVSRLQICQFDRVADIVYPQNDPDFKKLWEFREKLDSLKFYWGMSHSMSYGIFSEEVSDTARTLWDIHQVIRNRLSYDANPGITPENRWEKGKFTVDFDEPFHANKEIPLVKVKRED
jgi:hypothetical protein